MIIEKGLGNTYTGRLSNQKAHVSGFTRMEVIDTLLHYQTTMDEINNHDCHSSEEDGCEACELNGNVI